MPKIYQVFVGCPFRKNIRSNYERLKRELEAATPLSIVLADTGEITSTDYLLQHISGLISGSAASIFDVTGGNPNVSLEVGIAHALPADYLLTVSTRKPRTPAERQAEKDAKTQGEVKAIISDLQGKNRIEYKTFMTLKEQVERRYLTSLPYMKRWNQFRSEHKGVVPYVLTLFEEVRRSGRSKRSRLTAILDGSGFKTSDVSSALVKARLLVTKRGQMGGYFYPVK